MFDGCFSNSIIKRAIAKDLVKIELINIRDYTLDSYGRVDSAPVGGGAGLVMKCQPVVDCIEKNKTSDSHIIMLSPRGKNYNQKRAHELAKEKELVLVCGHYEGIDERVNKYIDEQISIGDYIVTGGELGAMVISDSVIRLLEGAIASESTEEESYENGLLEYPQYTEPYDYRGDRIPDILYSGNHEAIRKWRQKKSLLLTKELRPDLMEEYTLTKEDIKLLEEGDNPKWEQDAISKGKKFIKS